MEEFSEPVLLTNEQCVKYKDRLTVFYYSNIMSCSFMDSFSYEDAVHKIEGLIEHVSNGNAWVWGVFEKKSLIGYIWAYKHQFREEARVYVSEIHVDKPYRNKGIGKQLLTAVEELAKEKGYKALYIHTEGNNDVALGLYKKEGYVIERVQLRKEI